MNNRVCSIVKCFKKVLWIPRKQTLLLIMGLLFWLKLFKQNQKCLYNQALNWQSLKVSQILLRKRKVHTWSERNQVLHSFNLQSCLFNSFMFWTDQADIFRDTGSDNKRKKNFFCRFVYLKNPTCSLITFLYFRIF